MNIYPHRTKLRSHWLRKPFSASYYRYDLVDQGSLTARLQARYADFHVRPLFQKRAKPNHDESMLLKLNAALTVNVRDVLLMGRKRPVVYAHSILPYASLRGEWAKLGRLGNQPLGATLFRNPRVKRTPFSYKKLMRNHMLYQQVVKQLEQAPAYLWARRSIFSLNCAKILVTEIFLPQTCDE